MMNPSLKNQCKLNPGTEIVGKWHSNQYTIIKELGFGANGVVYLAKNKNTQVALKMSENGMSITSEVNVLKAFAKVQGSTLGPCLLDVDDWVNHNKQISFYAMEYIHGPDLLSFLQQKGKSWTSVLFLQLLNDLDKLHENGWIFGDLKPDNLIVTGPAPRIRCIDVGGTTLEGRGIKEFTEFFDRGYWGLGTRRAEPSYDLFAVAMIMINTAYPKRFNKTSGGLAQLKDAIRERHELKPLEKIILKSLQGYYVSAKQMRADLLNILVDKKTSDSTPPPAAPSSNLSKQSAKQTSKVTGTYTRQTYRKKKKKQGWKETLWIAVIMVLLYSFISYITLK